MKIHSTCKIEDNFNLHEMNDRLVNMPTKQVWTKSCKKSEVINDIGPPPYQHI